MTPRKKEIDFHSEIIALVERRRHHGSLVFDLSVPMPKPSAESSSAPAKHPEGRMTHTLREGGYNTLPEDIAELLLEGVQNNGDLPEVPECREVIAFIVANRTAMIRVLDDITPRIFKADPTDALKSYAYTLYHELFGYSEFIAGSDEEEEKEQIASETQRTKDRILQIFAGAANLPIETSLPPSPTKNAKKRK